MKEFFVRVPLIAVSILVILSSPLSAQCQEAPGTSLTKLQNTFLTKKTELDASRLDKRAELLKRYGDVLTRIKQSYQTAGKLNETVLVTKEWEAAQKGELQTWPATATPPPDLGNARKVAQAELEKIDRQHGNDLSELGGRYLKALEGLKTTLTQAGKIDEGLAVVKEIENLNSLLERLSEGRGTAGFKRDLPPALRKDLVVYFSFDEKDGNILSSSSETPIKGILEGTKFVPAGKVGGARYFSGNRDRVALSSPLPDSKEMTIALWMKFQGDLKTGGLFADYDEKNANDMTLSLLDSKTIHIRADKTGGVLMDEVKLRSNFSDGWHHLVWVMESDKSTLYLDGHREERVAKTATNIGFHKAYIGFGHNQSEWTYFKGEIDEFMYWSRALSPNEAAQVFGLISDNP